MSDPRKHHFLPQFYLRGFSTDGRGLFQVEKPGATYYGAQVKDLAAIRDFHELDHDGATDRHALERHLASLEGEQARDVAQTLSDGLQDTGLLARLVQFLAVMRMRVPAVKAHIEGSYKFYVRATGLMLERSGRLPPVPPGMEEALSIKNLQIEVSNWKCLEKMFALGSNEKTLDIMYGMRATLFRAPFGDSFVTGDQPVALFHAKKGGTAEGVGPGTLGVEVSLPLSSRALLLLDHSPGAHSEQTASSNEVAEFNRRTIAMAQRYLFTGENPKRLAASVRADRGSTTGFVYDNIDAGREFLQVQRFIAVGPEM